MYSECVYSSIAGWTEYLNGTKYRRENRHLWALLIISNAYLRRMDSCLVQPRSSTRYKSDSSGLLGHRIEHMNLCQIYLWRTGHNILIRRGIQVDATLREWSLVVRLVRTTLTRSPFECGLTWRSQLSFVLCDVRGLLKRFVMFAHPCVCRGRERGGDGMRDAAAGCCRMRQQIGW